MVKMMGISLKLTMANAPKSKLMRFLCHLWVPHFKHLNQVTDLKKKSIKIIPFEATPTL
jgi:hypothetical protein